METTGPNKCETEIIAASRFGQAQSQTVEQLAKSTQLMKTRLLIRV